MNIKKLIRPNIRSLTAYSAKEIPCRVKLDANESPYGLSESVLADLMSSKSRKLFRTINRYPDPEGKAIKKILSKDLRLKPANILLGNGSDELIYYLITTFGGPVLYPVPTFSMYGIISKALNEKCIPMPLDNEFDIDIEPVLKAIRKERPRLIFLSSPNNPTGNCFSSEKILKIIEVSKGIVVVDEAYHMFSSEMGFLPLLKDYRNLAIMRTLSKIGLAGLRLGFLIADTKIIEEVNKVRLPFNVNSISQAIASKVLKDKSRLNSVVQLIASEREKLFNEMERIKGIRPYPSEANFILFKVKDPDRVYNALLKKSILVRNIKDVIKGCLRVTVGTPKENKAFLQALQEILG